MIKAILAIDDKGGVGKNGSMPWPHNLKDLQWFKENTLGHVVIMGKNTWIDPNMPTPLTKRVNVLATTTDPTEHPGADHYIKGDLIENINELEIFSENLSLNIRNNPIGAKSMKLGIINQPKFLPNCTRPLLK